MMNSLTCISFPSVDKCRFMDSKKRPLYLVFTNTDPEGPDIHIIFKNGDGKEMVKNATYTVDPLRLCYNVGYNITQVNVLMDLQCIVLAI